jgi:hypothetical protein
LFFELGTLFVLARRGETIKVAGEAKHQAQSTKLKEQSSKNKVKEQGSKNKVPVSCLFYDSRFHDLPG